MKGRKRHNYNKHYFSQALQAMDVPTHTSFKESTEQKEAKKIEEKTENFEARITFHLHLNIYLVAGRN